MFFQNIVERAEKHLAYCGGPKGQRGFEEARDHLKKSRIPLTADLSKYDHLPSEAVLSGKFSGICFGGNMLVP